MSKKRQRTVWLSRANYQGGTYIRVGRVHNSPDVPADIIRYQVKSSIPGASADFMVTVDEALALAAALTSALATEMLPKSDKLRRMFR